MTVRLAFAALLACTPLAAGAAGAADRWYEVRVDDVAAGYEHEVATDAPAGGTQTHREMQLVLSRLDARISLGEDDLVVEDAAGRPTSLRTTLHESTDDTIVEVAVEPDRLVVTQTAGGRRYVRELPAEPGLLGPEGIRARTRAWLADPGSPLAYAMFEADLGTTVHVTRRFAGRDASGHALVEERIEGTPGASQLVLDDEGRALAETEDSPFGRVSVLLSDTARARSAAGAGPRAEVYARTLRRANVRLPDARRLDRLRVAIALDDPEVAWPDLEGPGQHVVEATPRRRVLELSRVVPAADPPPSAAPSDPDLQPNVLLQSDHPAVVALAESLRRPGAGTLAQSLLLRDWVATHLSFDLGLAVVPAGEIVRDRRGTCVAYAVLTASLARALGIPARVVLGYVYLDGVFGGHAWTEVRVGETWVPVDAAVWGPGAADPARIALARHGGESGIGSGAVELARLLGRISVRIEGYSLDGRRTRVPADAPPYRIDGRRYRNPWLGLSLEAPAGYRYAALDAVYPDPTVLRLDGPGEARITLRSTPVGPGTPALRDLGPARCESRPDGRRCVRRAGGTQWVLEATPGAASTRLDVVLRSLRIQP